MMKQVIGAVCLSLALLGCSSQPRSVDVERYDSVGDMLAAEFPEPTWVGFYTNPDNQLKLNPDDKAASYWHLDAVTAYCAKVARGKLVKIFPIGAAVENVENINARMGWYQCRTAAENAFTVELAAVDVFQEPRGVWLEWREVPQADVVARTRAIEARRAAEQREEEARRQKQLAWEREEQQRIAANFKEAVAQGHVRGTKICTMDNRIGVVEDISGNRIKVHLGGGPAEEIDRGFFFRTKGPSPHGWQFADRGYRWEDADRWGRCHY